MSDIKINAPNKIIADLGLQEGGEIHKFFTQACATHMEKYVPYKKGTLSDYKLIDNNTAILYDAPYAHYMYLGKVMGPNIPIKKNGVVIRWFSKKPKHYTGKDLKYSKGMHERANSHWDIRMVVREKDELIEEVQREVARRSK